MSDVALDYWQFTRDDDEGGRTEVFIEPREQEYPGMSDEEIRQSVWDRFPGTSCIPGGWFWRPASVRVSKNRVRIRISGGYDI